jgi:hypothetical protein
MKRIPIYDATAPIACTISAEEIPERIQLIERIRSHLRDVQRTEHGLLLRLPNRADIEADVGRFAVDEKRCCQFWSFEVISGDELTFRWDGPPAAAELLERVAVFLTGDEPASALAGML